MSPGNTNFRAAIYQPDKNIFGDEAKPVLVFKGTENMEDWKNNFQQGIGGKSSYYEKAIYISSQMTKNGAVYETAGHSLGGGLSSAAAKSSGLDATTFNAAGLHKKTVSASVVEEISFAQENIKAFRLDGEILTFLQEEAFIVRKLMVPAVGEKIIIPNDKPSAGRLGKHGMDHVIPAIEQQKTEDLYALSS
jgi:hypothetical protein